MRSRIAYEREHIVGQERRLGLGFEDGLPAPHVGEVGVAERAEPGLLDRLPGEARIGRDAELELVVAATSA